MLRRTLYKVVVGTALAGVTLACGGSVDDAVEVPFAEICAEDDRWITSEGVLALGEETSCESIGDSQQCHVLLADPDGSRETVTVTFDVGDKENTMNDIPDNYSDEDLVIRDNAGTTVGIGDRVRVTGTASNNEQKWDCRVWVRRVEAVP